MKKLLLVLLSLLLTLSLCACGGSEEPVQEAPPEASSVITDTEVLPPVSSPAQEVSDEALLQSVNETLFDQYYFLYGLRPGAVFQLEWEPYTTTPSPEGYDLPWFPVVDPEVQSLDDIRAVWAGYFCSSVPMPEEYLESYREFDGVLCSCCMGIGDDMTFREIRAEQVLSRDGEAATVLAVAYHQDVVTEEPYTVEYHLPMVWEDGQWKTADIQLVQ
ncbi:MAG: hypothetical protein IJE03_05615 [Ruminiclostridium sp.]|nr:hypothetical protein [Ruminiclostridium sp.]